MNFKKNKDMVGLYAEQPYQRGDVLFELRGPIKANATSTSIQISEAKHIEDAYAQYINHNCDASAKIVGRKVIAQKDLVANNEITLDKNEMADELQKPFVCNCCGKLIQGKKYILA